MMVLIFTLSVLSVPVPGLGGGGGAAGVDPLGITGGDPGQFGQSGGQSSGSGGGWTWNGTAWGKWTFVNGQYGFFSPATQQPAPSS